MSTTALATTTTDLSSPATAEEIRSQVNLIQQVMKAVMKADVHYGTIPGTPKPTLYKAGSEKILSTFRIGIDPVVEDLSTPDAARYRVTARAVHQASGTFLGAGVGECSSNEEKYRWRRPVCREEWEATPEDHRRVKWAKGRDGAYEQQQIRTHPSDVANTILKMAKKRAQIDACLTVTAASDVFAQDIEDLPEELREDIARDTGTGPASQPPIAPPQRKSTQAASQPTAATPPPSTSSPRPSSSAALISEGQAKRLFAIGRDAGWRDGELREFLLKEHGFNSIDDVTRDKYDAIVDAVRGGDNARA